MGFLKQDAPVVDHEQWSKGTRAEKIVPMARHWAEVAAAVVFLASDDAANIHGAVLSVDGGWAAV